MSELIRREDAINAVEMFFKDAYIEDSDVHCTDMVYEINHIPTSSPWHRVDEEPRDGQECIVAHLGPTDWIYEHATYHSDLNKALEEDIFIEGTDGFIVDGDVGYARHGLFKYWMPIEPPKEDADEP